MRKIFHWMIVATMAMTLGAGAGLAKKKPTVKNRQINQQRRIHHGAHNQSLTGPEYARLQRNSARIHRGIVRDKHDGGVFTPRERAKSQHRLNKQSRAIKRQKHDGQTR